MPELLPLAALLTPGGLHRRAAVAHAYIKHLQPALNLHLQSEEDRRAFRPNDVKWLCKPGTRQAMPLWDRHAGSVGDLVLVQVNPEENSDSGNRNWDIAVIRDPQGDPKRKPGLRDTAEGKQVSICRRDSPTRRPGCAIS